MSKSRRTARTAVDWAEVRARLTSLQASVDGALKLSPERTKALLDERAQRLARPTTDQRPGGDALTVAIFGLANERYAIETKFVREIVRFVDFTPVPGAGDFLFGVTNLRGEILAVLDLRKLFGLSQQGLTDLSRVIVLGEGRNEFGMLADQAYEVIDLRIAEILALPESVAGMAREYLAGVTKDALIVLDGTTLLRDPRLYVDHSETLGAMERVR